MGIFTAGKLKSLKRKATTLFKARQQNPASDADIKKEIGLYLQMAALYDKHRFNKKFPEAESLAQENYRAAAKLYDANAQYILSKRLIDKGNFWRSIGKDVYASEEQEKYATRCYEEAFTYLKAAEEQGHSLAKRLHGVAYIRGWGVAQDEEQGFKLVVDSIEQEGAWDKATQIFEELGLNKPEFFSSIMSLRQKAGSQG